MTVQDRAVTLSGHLVSPWVTAVRLAPAELGDWGRRPAAATASLEFADEAVALLVMAEGRLCEVSQGPSTLIAAVVTEIRRQPQRGILDVLLDSVLQRKLNQPYVSLSNWDTPAALAQTMFEELGIPIDTASFARANEVLGAGPVIARINPDLATWQGTVGDVLAALAEAACGRFGINRHGETRFDVYDVAASQSITAILGPAQLADVVFESETTPAIDSVTIRTPAGDLTYPVGADQGLTLDFRTGRPVELDGLTSAAAVATAWLSVSQQSLERCRLRVVWPASEPLDVGRVVKLDLPDVWPSPRLGRIVRLETADRLSAWLTVELTT